MYIETIEKPLENLAIVEINGIIKIPSLDFPCGPVIKNFPAKAEDMALMPGLGRSHMPWVINPIHHNYCSLHTLEPVHQNCSARVPRLLKAVHPRASVLQQEKPPQWATCALHLDSIPHLLQLEKACAPQWRLSTATHTCLRFSRVQLSAALWTVACQAPLSMRTPQARVQEGATTPSFRDLHNSGVEPVSPVALPL